MPHWGRWPGRRRPEAELRPLRLGEVPPGHPAGDLLAIGGVEAPVLHPPIGHGDEPGVCAEDGAGRTRRQAVEGPADELAALHVPEAPLSVVGADRKRPSSESPAAGCEGVRRPGVTLEGADRPEGLRIAQRQVARQVDGHQMTAVGAEHGRRHLTRSEARRPPLPVRRIDQEALAADEVAREECPRRRRRRGRRSGWGGSPAVRRSRRAHLERGRGCRGTGGVVVPRHPSAPKGRRSRRWWSRPRP